MKNNKIFAAVLTAALAITSFTATVTATAPSDSVYINANGASVSTAIMQDGERTEFTEYESASVTVDYATFVQISGNEGEFEILFIPRTDEQIEKYGFEQLYISGSTASVDDVVVTITEDEILVYSVDGVIDNFGYVFETEETIEIEDIGATDLVSFNLVSGAVSTSF